MKLLIKLAALCLAALVPLAASAGQAGLQQGTVANNEASTTTTTLATTLPGIMLGGELICTGIAIDGGNVGITVSSVADGTNTYSLVQSATNNGGTIKERAEMWCASNATAGGPYTITVTISGAPGTSGGIQVIIGAYSGVDTGSVASITNASSTNTGNSTTATTGNIVTSQQTLVIGFVNTAPCSFTASSGFRMRATPAIGNAYQDQLNAPSGTYNVSTTINSTDVWAAVGAAFNVSTGITFGLADVQTTIVGSSPATWKLSNVEAGNIVVSGAAFGLNTASLTSTKDDLNNTFTNTAHSPEAVSGSGKVNLSYFCNESAGVRTITATYTGPSTDNFWAFEIFGAATACLDQENGLNNGSGASTTSPSITTTTTDLLIAVGGGAGTVSATSGNWVMQPILSGFGMTVQNNKAASTYNANFTETGTAGGWIVVLASFKAAAAAGGSGRNRTLLHVGQ